MIGVIKIKKAQSKGALGGYKHRS